MRVSDHLTEVCKAVDLFPADSTASPTARVLAAGMLVRFRDKGILNDTPEEFVETAGRNLDRLLQARPGLDISDNVFNVYGYGYVVEILADGDRGYFFGHDFAEALGIDAASFGKLARGEHMSDLWTQREEDERNGTLGNECLRWWPLGVTVWTGEGTAEEHADEHGTISGPVMGNYTDVWLVDSTLITYLAMLSPWGEEIQKAAEPMWAHGMRKSGLGNLADVLGSKDHGVTEDDAVRRALRGPRADLRVVRDEDGGPA